MAAPAGLELTARCSIAASLLRSWQLTCTEATGKAGELAAGDAGKLAVGEAGELAVGDSTADNMAVADNATMTAASRPQR